MWVIALHLHIPPFLLLRLFISFRSVTVNLHIVVLIG
nr:MAG TPA: hypothetical protein [Bacteriophage sp.]DAN02644.1 MAG TPA: hypothetical protein [Caudoviricetes sp.]